jgi:predicted SAM-dependent methyltransferase
MIKLHLGCGWRNFGEDWVHIDGGDYDHLDHHDVCKLPYEDDSVDLIYASHILAYFDREEASQILKEWRRVLKNGSALRVATPDFEAMSALYAKGEYTLDSFLGPLYGKMSMGKHTIYHKTAYDVESLKNMLLKAGFHDIIMYDWQDTVHAQFDDHSQAYLPHMDKESGTLISLNLECIKADEDGVCSR